MYAHIAFANHAPQMNKIDRCSGQPNLSCPIEKNAVSDRKIISHFGQCFSIEVFIHDEKNYSTQIYGIQIGLRSSLSYHRTIEFGSMER